MQILINKFLGIENSVKGTSDARGTHAPLIESSGSAVLSGPLKGAPMFINRFNCAYLWFATAAAALLDNYGLQMDVCEA